MNYFVFSRYNNAGYEQGSQRWKVIIADNKQNYNRDDGFRRLIVKKKLVLGVAVIFSSSFLFACGNPLKELPVAGEFNRYIDSSTENEFLDEALQDLKQDEAVKGIISSVIVYGREDDSENKDQSDVYIKVDSETSSVLYENYYILDFRYSKETGWHMKDFERDTSEQAIAEPKENLTPEQVEEDLIQKAPKTSVLGGEVQLDFTSDLKSVEILSEEIEKITPDYIPSNQLEAKFEIDGGYCSYVGTAEILYKYYDTDELDGWFIEEVSIHDDVERVLTDDTLKTFADKRMLNIICTDDIQIGNRIFTITEENVASAEFEDCVFSGDKCTRNANVTLATGSQMPITIDASFAYTYTESGWKMDEFTRELHYERPQLVGEYSGDIYNSKEEMEAGEEKIGRAHYSILEQDEEGNISGAIRYLNDGQEAPDVEPIYFEANYYENNMTWTVIFVSDVDDKNYGFNYEDLVFDPFTGDLVVDRRTHYYRLILR